MVNKNGTPSTGEDNVLMLCELICLLTARIDENAVEDTTSDDPMQFMEVVPKI